MSVFKPNSNKNQDVGGTYGDPCKVPQNLGDLDISVRGPNNQYPAYQQCASCPSGVCVVDQSGNPYPTDGDGCFVVPSGVVQFIDESGAVCIVDESGTPYAKNGSGCFIIPSDYLVQSDLSGYIQYAVDESGNFYATNASGYLIIPTAGSVETSGCITGDGSVSSPVSLVVDPSGGIYCGASGLTLDGSGCGFAWSFETGACPSGATAPEDPVATAVQGTMQLEVYPYCLQFWYYNGATWELRGTLDTLSVSGDGSGIDCAQMTTLESNLTGGGTFASPYTACDIDVVQPCTSNFTIDNRHTVYFELGQGGFLVADGPIDQQGRWVVPEGYQLEVTKAYWTLGASGTTNTTVQFYTTQGNQAGTPITAGAADFTATLPSGLQYGTIALLEGTYNNLVHIQERVDVAGAGAKDLLIQVWGRICPID